MALIDEYRDLLKLLTIHEVSFILIGGYAVNYHGYARTTADMDLWIEPDNANKFRLIRALKDFGITETQLQQLKEIDFELSTSVFYLGEPPRRIDFLTRIAKVEFQEAAATAVKLKVEDFEIQVISYKYLILSKIMSDRLKDKADVEELQKINRKRIDKNRKQ